jgi:hypothetical protein
MLAAIQWGTLPGWLTLAVLVGAALWLPRRGASGPAIQSLEANNRVLEGRVHELEQQGKADAALIAELRGRTDVTLALAPIVEWSAKHEERAQQRHESMLKSQDGTLKVLALIARKFGAEDAEAVAE